MIGLTDFVKRRVLILVGEIPRYRNNQLLLLLSLTALLYSADNYEHTTGIKSKVNTKVSYYDAYLNRISNTTSS